MSYFSIEKTLAKPGDVINVFGDCTSPGSFGFDTTDHDVAVVDGSHTKIQVVGVGETGIFETSSYCDNTGSILLTVTDEGKAPMLSKDDYTQFQIYETVFVCFILFIAWFLKFMQKS